MAKKYKCPKCGSQMTQIVSDAQIEMLISSGQLDEELAAMLKNAENENGKKKKLILLHCFSCGHYWVKKA